MTEPGWLKQVHTAADAAPPWLMAVLEHPKFAELRRHPEGGWDLVPLDELQFKADTLREVCQQFATHYGL